MTVPVWPRDACLRVPLVNDGLGKCRFGTSVPPRDGECSETGSAASGIAPLAFASGPWQWGEMNEPAKKSPTGAGAIIAILTLAGTFIGGFMGQPSIGLLTGIGLGVVIALLLWLRERDR
jgi:hypothetical protein